MEVEFPVVVVVWTAIILSNPTRLRLGWVVLGWGFDNNSNNNNKTTSKQLGNNINIKDNKNNKNNNNINNNNLKTIGM